MGDKRVEYFDPSNGKLGFALASKCNGYVHVSGMTGFEKDMTIPEGMEVQMRLAYENIRGILAHYGLSFEDIAEQTLFFVGDPEPAFEAYGIVARDEFGDAPPPATMVGVTHLIDRRYVIEIKVSAACRDGS